MKEKRAKSVDLMGGAPSVGIEEEVEADNYEDAKKR